MSDETTPPSPETFYSSQAKKRPIFWVIGGIILFAILTTLLNRFGYLPKLNSNLDKINPTTTPITSNKSDNSYTQKLSLHCPVADNLCDLGEALEYSGKPAMIFNLPKGTPVIAMEESVNFSQFISPPFKKDSPKGFSLTALADNSCYTITYIFPSDATIEKFSQMPVAKDTKVATIGTSFINVGKQKANLIVLMQKKPIIPNSQGKPEAQKCNSLNIKEISFGEYQYIDRFMFIK